MTVIKAEFYIEADGDLGPEVENCLTDEALVNDFVASGAFAIRNAIAEYLKVPQRHVSYDFHVFG